MRNRPDLMTLLGLVIAIGGVIGGFHLDDGHLRSLLSSTAFMIVIVGSFGAVLVATPREDVVRGFRGFGKAILPSAEHLGATRDRILELASLARREGLLSLEEFTQRPDADPFLVKCLTHAIDGTGADVIRRTVETEMAIEEDDAHAGARFWEAWGSLCPTIGVLGAVLGLMHVMQKLDTPGEIGGGIATAFVATVYGVGFSNLVCLPIAFKMKRQLERERVRKSMVLEGVVGIQSGLAPGALRNRLSVYVAETADAA
jgi:chemotaxis protein MotA